MRSKLITAVAVVTSTFLGASVAAADPVQEQLRLMEQRMAEMEDRLQATSEKLENAEATVQQQQSVLSEAGLAESDGGHRSAVGTFLQQVDVSGLVAASYNHRFLGGGDNGLELGNSFRHQSADTFSLDQLWLTLDKPTTEESRAGFHGDILYGESARVMRNSIIGSPIDSQIGSGVSDEDDSWDDIYLFSAYVSYLAPIGNGIRFDLGKRDTLMGIERVKTNVNYNVTQGRVFQLIPIVNTGLLAQTNLTDQISIAAGVFNDVYADSSIDDSRHKAYFSQIAYQGDRFGFKVDSMVGKSSANNLQTDNGDDCESGNACRTSVLDAVATAQLSDSLEAWFQFVWARNWGDSILAKGDTHAFATAARFHLTEDTSVATRIEYLRAEHDFNRAQDSFGQSETVTATLTGAHKLTSDLTFRTELRYDRNLAGNDSFLFAVDNQSDNLGQRKNPLLGIAELYYEF